MRVVLAEESRTGAARARGAVTAHSATQPAQVAHAATPASDGERRRRSRAGRRDRERMGYFGISALAVKLTPAVQ